MCLWIGTISLLVAFDSVSAVGDPARERVDRCPVVVEIAGARFQFANLVHPRLLSLKGRKLVYLPVRYAPGFVAESADNLAGTQRCVVDYITAKDLGDVVEQGVTDEFPVNWTGVQAQVSRTTFRVLPGKYRFRLSLLLESPDSDAEFAKLYTIYSDSFEVTEATDWTRFR